jgi:hypothetical protein
MARLYRLLSPGLSFAMIGLVVLALGQWFWILFQDRFTIVGIYAFAGQVLFSALLVSAIDDLSGSSPWHLVGRGTGALLRISARPVSFRRALAEFYRLPFWPVCLLGFGFAASLTTFAVGIFQETNLPVNADNIPIIAGIYMVRSEVLLASVLVLGAALLWWRGSASYFGWVIGICLATMLGQIVFAANVNPGVTALSWAGGMTGLCLLRLLAFAAVHVWRTWFRSGPATELSSS